MAQAEVNWERLVRAVLHRQRTGYGKPGQPVTGIAGNVPSCLTNNLHIDEILRAADEVGDEDPSISRILCEHAYSLAQNLDPNSEGRGVLQFKTGLMSVIKQKLAKREGGSIDRSQDIDRLLEFYKRYREKHKVDELREDEMRMRQSGVYSGNLGELERKTRKRKQVFATLKVLGSVIEDLTQEISPDDADRAISDEMKNILKSDAEKTEDIVAYNIIPLDAPSLTNAIVNFSEVKAAISALKYFSGLPKLPDHISIPSERSSDMLDFLEYVFGFQKGNVCNQREHVVHLLANEQSRLGSLIGNEPKIDETAVHLVFLKSLENYRKWCSYLPLQPVWNNLESLSTEKRLLFVCLYFLIWGEAANVRFLPECLCYIFHHMAREMEEILRQEVAQPAESCKFYDKVSFLDQVISPLYEVIAAEAANNDDGRAPHSAWRNYDDFNEYFWSIKCFQPGGLGWPWRLNSPFFTKPTKSSKGLTSIGGHKRFGKTSFVEHRTFLHLYHSFHRLWMFLVMMFQGLTIIAFNEGRLNLNTFAEVLSLGPTYVVMKFIVSLLDILMMYGAYSTSRRSVIMRTLWHFIWFSVASLLICYLYVKSLQGGTDSFTFKIYVFIVGIYAAIHFFISFLMRIPFCHRLTEPCDRWSLPRLVKWMHQEHNYVGRGMYEKATDYLKYVLFWLVILAAKFSFAYFVLIKPLVSPTQIIIGFKDLRYSWHDFISKNNHNALTILCIWAPVFTIYLMDIQVFYTVFSSIYSFLLGAGDRLGEIRSVEAVHKLFEKFPGAFMDNLHVDHPIRKQLQSSDQEMEMKKFDAAKFAPFWNEIIRSLREEDYITNFEMDLLFMPKNSGILPLVQWPLFLLASKIFLAKDIATENRDSQDDLWDRIKRDDYMKYAVEEAYHAIQHILSAIVSDEGQTWVDLIYENIKEIMMKKRVLMDFKLANLALVISRVTALTGVLKEESSPELAKGAVKAMQDLYDVIHHDFLLIDMRDHYEQWNVIYKARAEGHLFSKLKWPRDPDLKALVRRLHSLLTIKDSAANIPKNLEARRRLQFFTNSLSMKMPKAKLVSEMLSFSVFTPYYSEIVLYSIAELQQKNEDGISTLFYLQKIFPDEWKNFLSRIGRDENAEDAELFDNQIDVLELRFWASYRGQTLARTVRGMMYYRKALMLQSYLERMTSEDPEVALDTASPIVTKDYLQYSPDARAQADLKFTYVVTCQIYGKQREEKKPEAADIALLMQRYEALRIAYIDVVETVKEGKPQTEYYSKLVKADISGKDKEIYSIKLPGNPKIGEGKPENQNHAIVFTRGNAVQTIDMNQDNYFEEALKMRNLLEEFHQNHGLRRPTILGVREHVFTGSVSSLASFMSSQETSFVTLGQRVLARPLKVRMHYGHPDVFDRIFHITRGGISKASRVINISEDIYAGFNSTLRQGNVTHHEFIQVGKGRDVGLNQIALFEGKVASGNGEQVLSRDVYRLGQLFDFFRMLSFYFTTVGYYFCTMLTVLTVYIFLYGKAYLALSGVGDAIQDRANILQNASLDAAINTQFLFQIGVFTAVPMILGSILEQGILSAFVSFTTMQLQLCSVFFTFSLGTRTHYFGRTILHGGAKYRATGRGFVVRHIKFSENYRLYSRSHFVKGLEVVLLLVVFLAYGYNSGAVSYILLSLSSWIMALSWLFAPYLFNPSGFEWQKTVEDFKDWTNWLFYRGGIGVKGEESWEAWWEEELVHIRTMRGRILEIILSSRFFIFQYGIVYKLHASGTDTSLTVYGLSWIVLAVLFVLFQVFTFSQKASVNFQLVLRLVQSLSFLLVLAGLAVAIVLTELSLLDIFACILAFVPTGWGILSIAVACRPLVKRLHLWKSVRSLARLYDAGMGVVIFIPVAIASWFPFVSTFQTRLLYNQAFSRGLEISLILAGNNPNTGI